MLLDVDNMVTLDLCLQISDIIMMNFQKQTSARRIYSKKKKITGVLPFSQPGEFLSCGMRNYYNQTIQSAVDDQDFYPSHPIIILGIK